MYAKYAPKLMIGVVSNEVQIRLAERRRERYGASTVPQPRERLAADRSLHAETV